MSNIVKYLIAGAVLVIGLIYLSDSSGREAYSSLDFAGSVGFDMFDEHDGNTPFRNHDNNDYYYHDDDDDDNHNYYGDNYQSESERELTVRIVAGKYNMPDFEISTRSDSKITYGNEFEDDSKVKTRLHIDDNDNKVCIKTINSNYKFKQCKPINGSDEITFKLTPKNN